MEKSTITELFYTPPIIKARIIPSGIQPIIGAGIFTDSNIEEAIKVASEKGLILPRHSDKLTMLTTKELDISKKISNKTDWESIRMSGYVLCFKEKQEFHALVKFEHFAEYCNAKQENGSCKLSENTCYEEGCPLWQHKFQKVIIEE